MRFLVPPVADERDYRQNVTRIALEAAFRRGFTRMYSDGRIYGQLEAYPLTAHEWAHLQAATEGAFAVAQKLTAMAKGAPDSLLAAVDLMPDYYPWFRQAPASAPFTRFARVDWVRDEAGRWHLLEYNAREPGGLPELAGIDLIFDLYRRRGVPVENPNQGFRAQFAAMMRAVFPPGMKVGFCTVPGYLEDYENAAAAARIWGGEAVFGGWPEVADDGTVLVSGEPVDGLYLYLPTELYWKRPGLLERLAAGNLPVINPGSALFMQSKKALALMHQLCAMNQHWTPTERAFIDRYIPYTDLVPFAGEWVGKPAWDREGAGVYLGSGEGLGRPEYVYQRRIAVEQGDLPIFSVAGPLLEPVRPVVGVYLINGKAAGVLTRVGGVVTDKAAHVVPTFILNEGAEHHAR